MRRTRIKICGVCHVKDALLAAGMGADAIGMIMQPAAKRFVEAGVAREIVNALPPFVTAVGVFVDAGAQTIREVSREVGMRCVQLHGAETEKDIAELGEFAVMKAIKVDRTLPEQMDKWSEIAERHRHFRGLVLETGGTTEAGGTGIENDWAFITEAMAKSRGMLPIIAAGGLRPENVGEIVRRLRPYAVDVSSGVEEAVRVKSFQKIEDFIAGVREADLVGGDAA